MRISMSISVLWTTAAVAAAPVAEKLRALLEQL